MVVVDWHSSTLAWQPDQKQGLNRITPTLHFSLVLDLCISPFFLKVGIVFVMIYFISSHACHMLSCLLACRRMSYPSMYSPISSLFFFIHLRKRKEEKEEKKPCTITAKTDKRFVAVVFTIPRREQDPMELRTIRHAHIANISLFHSLMKNENIIKKTQTKQWCQPAFLTQEEKEKVVCICRAERSEPSRPRPPVPSGTQRVAYMLTKRKGIKREKRYHRAATRLSTRYENATKKERYHTTWTHM